MPRVQFSEDRRDEVLQTALDLAGERGIEGVTVDAVALRCRVSKATLYRHWPSKEALLVSAVQRKAMATWAVPQQDSFRGDVLQGLRTASAALVAADDLLLTLADAGRRNPVLAEETRRRLSEPHAAMWSTIAARWQGAPGIRAGVDFGWLGEVCESLVTARLLSPSQPLTDSYLVRFVDEVIVPLFVD